MNWEQLLSAKRFGMEHYEDVKKHERTEYQRDYDRLIFSSPFRRLQNKTQVFPLPGSVFVHNRLTHSLEVSSVGRSLGENIARKLRSKHPISEAHFEEIGAIVSAACLAHDLGNPPFGHSGEKAISTFFSEGKGACLR
ncbi:MAG: dNTP triphosphohydrolase, partial [Proteiniphilum sp.]|nr:dNTP triphosphohydrolase [Proteiniphilum sp.]